MKQTVLFLHAAQPPEFREVEAAARYLYPPNDADPNTVTYEGMGKFMYTLESDDTVSSVAEIRIFAHPDFVDGIRQHGKVRIIPHEPGWAG